MYDKLKLWFFRDLTDYQRRQLFSVFGMPVDEIGYWHGKQEHALRHVVRSLTVTKPDTAPAPHLVGLTLASLQRSHVERQEEWCPDQKPDLSFRGNELGGECGEAQNVIKKLERERHGWRGSRDTVQHLAEELADVIHCAILVAITAGIEIEPAVVAKFNDTSQKNGLRTLLASEGQSNG